MNNKKRKKKKFFLISYRTKIFKVKLWYINKIHILYI